MVSNKHANMSGRFDVSNSINLLFLSKELFILKKRETRIEINKEEEGQVKSHWAVTSMSCRIWITELGQRIPSVFCLKVGRFENSFRDCVRRSWGRRIMVINESRASLQ